MPQQEDRAQAIYEGATWLSRNRGFISMVSGFGAVVVAIVVTCGVVIRWADAIVHSNDLRMHAVEITQKQQADVLAEQTKIIASIREEQIRRSTEFGDIQRLWERCRELEARIRSLEIAVGMAADMTDSPADVYHEVSMPYVGDTPTDYVDKLELNHYYSDIGKHVLTQLIGWEFHPHDPSQPMVVVFWKMVKQDKAHQFSPTRTASGGWEVLFHDGDRLRNVHGRKFQETWTQYDPEMRNRTVWPRDKRRKLTPFRTPESTEA